MGYGINQPEEQDEAIKALDTLVAGYKTQETRYDALHKSEVPPGWEQPYNKFINAANNLVDALSEDAQQEHARNEASLIGMYATMIGAGIGAITGAIAAITEPTPQVIEQISWAVAYGAVWGAPVWAYHRMQTKPTKQVQKGLKEVLKREQTRTQTLGEEVLQKAQASETNHEIYDGSVQAQALETIQYVLDHPLDLEREDIYLGADKPAFTYQ